MKGLVIANDKYFDKKGIIKCDVISRNDLTNSLMKLCEREDRYREGEDYISITDFKKKLLKSKNISDEMKILEDYGYIVLIDIPERYEDFIHSLFYDHYAKDQYKMIYGEDRLFTLVYYPEVKHLTYLDE